MKSVMTDMEGTFLEVLGSCPNTEKVLKLYKSYLESPIEDVVEWVVRNAEKILEQGDV
jgi:dihydroxyacetone kinase-like predicted kinase